MFFDFLSVFYIIKWIFKIEILFMKKKFLIKLLFFCFFILLNNKTFAQYESVNINIKDKFLVIFESNKSNLPKLETDLNNIFNISCNWNFKFNCGKWLNVFNKNKYWCWIERVWKELWLEENWTCRIESKPNSTRQVWLNINLKALSYYKNLSFDLDISNKFIYKRLQKKALSCEASATSDILSEIKWYNITEDDVIFRMPKSDFYEKIAIDIWWEKFWWDPDLWFVWYIDKYNFLSASQPKYQWYWVYEKPIQKVFLDYWIKSEIINKYNYIDKNLNTITHLRKLLISLNEWKFVQLWWDICTYTEYEDGKLQYVNQDIIDKWFNWINYCLSSKEDRILSWNVKNSNWIIKQINWLNWEHAFYLLWYRWWVENPTYIIVWDTNTWKHTYKIEEWLRKWWKMDNRSLIVN